MGAIVAVIVALIIGVNVGSTRGDTEVQRDYSVEQSYSATPAQNQDWSGQ